MSDAPTGGDGSAHRASGRRVRPPLQSRSRRTLERIVQAALDLIESEGPDAATVQRIVRRAGSSVGSFYARFGGKDDLLEYLDTRVWTEASRRWEEALTSRSWEELTLEEVVAGSVQLLVEAHETHRAYRSGMGPETRSPHYRAFRTRVMDGVAELVLGHAARIDHPEPAVAARVGALAVAGAIEGADHFDLHMKAELERLYLAYLGSPVEGEPREAKVDFFDIWG